MNDLPTRLAVKMVALALTAIVTGLLISGFSSEQAALISGALACVIVLAGWECWNWNARRRR